MRDNLYWTKFENDAIKLDLAPQASTNLLDENLTLL